MTLLQGMALTLKLGGRQILDGVNIELQPGEMLGLIGPNGAGKSTLLKLLAGLLEPDTGELRLGEQAYPNIPPERRARRIAWLAQQGELHWPVTVETLLELGRAPHLSPWQKPAEHDREVIERVLSQCDLIALRERPVDTLSGGERARVLLARALATEPEILLADEPVSALDPAHQLDMLSLLANYCSQGPGVILILHDLPLAAHFCHRLHLLHQGRTLAMGSAEDVLSAEHLQTAYRIRPNQSNTSDPFAIPWQLVAPSARSD